VEIEGVVVDGVERPVEDPTNFQVRLQKSDLGHNVIVRFRQTASAHERLRHLAPEDHRLG
jgi:hypothetical protein